MLNTIELAVLTVCTSYFGAEDKFEKSWTFFKSTVILKNYWNNWNCEKFFENQNVEKPSKNRNFESWKNGNFQKFQNFEFWTLSKKISMLASKKYIQ